MARIEFARGRYGEIFRAASATRYALVYARTAFEIEHIVIERKGFALLSSLNHHIGKFLVLFEDNLFVILIERILVGGGTYDGFHTQLVEAEIEHSLNILSEVGVSVSKRAAHIVVFSASRFDEFLEFRHDYIVTSHAAYGVSEVVVYLFYAVEGQNDVVHFLVCEFDHVVVNEHTVGCERKAEVFAVLFLYRASVCHEVFDHLPVHKRFAAEEVHFEITTRSAVFDEKIEGAFAHFVGHKRALAVIFALRCKTIFAV